MGRFSAHNIMRHHAAKFVPKEPGFARNEAMITYAYLACRPCFRSVASCCDHPPCFAKHDLSHPWFRCRKFMGAARCLGCTTVAHTIRKHISRPGDFWRITKWMGSSFDVSSQITANAQKSSPNVCVPCVLRFRWLPWISGMLFCMIFSLSQGDSKWVLEQTNRTIHTCIKHTTRENALYMCWTMPCLETLPFPARAGNDNFAFQHDSNPLGYRNMFRNLGLKFYKKYSSW